MPLLARTSIAIALMLGAGLVAAACAPAVATPTPAAPTSAPAPPSACSFLTLTDAKTALGMATEPRREPSTTTDSRTFCTFRGSSGATELVVLAGDGGTAAFEHELSLDEEDLSAVRKPVTGVTDAYMISGSELAEPKVVVGVRRDDLWFTVSLQVAGAARTTLETRAIVAAGIALHRLAG